MKRCVFIPLAVWRLACKPRAVPPADPLTATAWCDGGDTTYRFEPAGYFRMRNPAGPVWTGNWFYQQPVVEVTATDVEINLRSGPSTERLRS